MTDIKLEIQSGKMGSKTKVAKKKITTVAEAAVDIMSELNKLDHAPIDYAERLFRLECLREEKKKIDAREKHLTERYMMQSEQGVSPELTAVYAEQEATNAQISKLLEDE